MSADAFEEDWQRPPGDINFLQDLLASLDGSRPSPPPPPPPPSSPQPPLSTTATNATNSKHNNPTSRRNVEYGEDENVAAAARTRERQIAVIDRRRRRAQRKCDAVDTAFERALERRMQALQHLALDPPAERLVGQGMTQYVPAALLPEDMLEDDERARRGGALPWLPHSVVEAHVQQQQQQGREDRPSASPAAITEGPVSRPNDQDALVFLTQLDAGGNRQSEASTSEDNTTRRAGSAGRTKNGQAQQPTGALGAYPTLHSGAPSPADSADDDDDDDNDEAWIRPANVTASNKDRWRELGYHVVVVGGDSTSAGGERAAARRAYQQATTTTATAASSELHAAPHAASHGWSAQGQSGRPSTLVSPSSTPSPKRLGNASNTAHSGVTARAQGPHTFSPSWATLAPLPPVCLIQRRLPEEDMTAAELRTFRAPVKSASRRRLGQDDHGRTWKTGGK